MPPFAPWLACSGTPNSSSKSTRSSRGSSTLQPPVGPILLTRSIITEWKTTLSRTHENKVALITGAGSGLGRGIALRLASDGARVAVVHLPIARHKNPLALLESPSDPPQPP